MKKWITATLATLAITTSALAATARLSPEMLQDIERHRAMAAAHTAAALCLESGKSDAVCEKQLQDACKGLAIGRFCGMKHAH